MQEKTTSKGIVKLEEWLLAILADPITKSPADKGTFSIVNGVLDARIYLKNTHGYEEWDDGQVEYEKNASSDSTSIADYEHEISYDLAIYKHFCLSGRILDCGGGAGTVREFLSKDVYFVSIDPWINAPFSSSEPRRRAYKCLNEPVNFIAANAEFIPFVSNSFDWVHMRSMLDHVQMPDLALLEASRVLKPNGRILIGLYVDGGKTGIISFKRRLKDTVKFLLVSLGINRWKDHHIWHPTYSSLLKLIDDNGFEIEDTFWQPQWQDNVCYVAARKKN